MLMFLTIFAVSLAGALAVQAMDLEYNKGAQRQAKRRQGEKTDSAYPAGVVGAR